jgi:hypothetical protein
MIASPCKNCPRENLPKTVCANECKLLKAVQNFQAAAHESDVASRPDYFMEIGYDMPQPFETTAASFWHAWSETEI